MQLQTPERKKEATGKLYPYFPDKSIDDEQSWAHSPKGKWSGRWWGGKVSFPGASNPIMSRERICTFSRPPFSLRDPGMKVGSTTVSLVHFHTLERIFHYFFFVCLRNDVYLSSKKKTNFLKWASVHKSNSIVLSLCCSSPVPKCKENFYTP